MVRFKKRPVRIVVYYLQKLWEYTRSIKEVSSRSCGVAIKFQQLNQLDKYAGQIYGRGQAETGQLTPILL